MLPAGILNVLLCWWGKELSEQNYIINACEAQSFITTRESNVVQPNYNVVVEGVVVHEDDKTI